MDDEWLKSAAYTEGVNKAMTDDQQIIIERQRNELETLRRLVVDLQGQLAQTQAHRAEAWDEVMRMIQQRHQALMVLLKV